MANQKTSELYGINIPTTATSGWTLIGNNYYQYFIDLVAIISYSGNSDNTFGPRHYPFTLPGPGTYQFTSTTDNVWVTGPWYPVVGLDYGSYLSLDLDNNYGGRVKSATVLAGGSAYISSRSGVTGTVTIIKTS